MRKNKKKIWFNSVGDSLTANTFIGGTSATITNETQLASKLSKYPSGDPFDSSDILNFTINGGDIECFIEVD